MADLSAAREANDQQRIREIVAMATGQEATPAPVSAEEAAMFYQMPVDEIREMMARGWVPRLETK